MCRLFLCSGVLISVKKDDEIKEKSGTYGLKDAGFIICQICHDKI